MTEKAFTMPTCSSCSKKISPDDIGAVKFRCPSCGEVVHIRCSRCRQIEITYLCPSCGFEGP